MQILWLKTELLHPVDKGGKIRTYQMLRELKRDHKITYLCLDDGSGDPQAQRLSQDYCDELITVPHSTTPKFSGAFYRELVANIASPLPYFMKKYESPGMRGAIEAALQKRDFDVLVCDFLQPSLNVPRRLPVTSVLFQHNVEAMIWKRHYEVQKNPFKRAYLYDQWRKTKKYEGAACRRFDVVIAVSREDATLMKEGYRLESVADVPTGVNTEYFRPSDQSRIQSHNIVFTGSMDWLPNEDAMQYFTREILPLIRAKVPDVSLTVVGRNPYPSLIELSKRDPAITVTGRVDDVRPFIESAAVYVVPIRVGGGTRLKIYEAMSMSKPVISTTIGAEGLPVNPNVDIIFADTANSFAEAVVRVLTNSAFAQEVGERARQLVCDNFGWQKVSARFAQICEKAVRSNKAHQVNSIGHVPVVN